MKNYKKFFGTYENTFDTILMMCNASEGCVMEGGTCPIESVLGVCANYNCDFDEWANKEAETEHVLLGVRRNDDVEQ